jgi:hypothetical protein
VAARGISFRRGTYLCDILATGTYKVVVCIRSYFAHNAQILFIQTLTLHRLLSGKGAYTRKWQKQ